MMEQMFTAAVMEVVTGIYFVDSQCNYKWIKSTHFFG